MKQRTPEQIAIANEGCSQSLKAYHANKKARDEWEALSDKPRPIVDSPVFLARVHECIEDGRNGMGIDEMAMKHGRYVITRAKEIGWTVR